MLLGVNIDHIATLRNARGGVEPDIIRCARLCERAGADSITTHLREDRRHIKDVDVRAIRKILKTRLNLEMAMTDEMQAFALEIKPHAVCLVPENRIELTTEGGLEIEKQLDRVVDFVKPLVDVGIQVSLFIDPDIHQVTAAYKSGAQFIELHTGKFAETFNTSDELKEFIKLKEAAVFATTLGLKVNAGHGLNYHNVLKMREIPNLVELNIGHSIISQAIYTGLAEAVKEMKDLVS